MHPMKLLDDEAQVEAHFGPFGDSANLIARSVHSLRRTYHRLINQFRCTQWYSNVMRLKRKLTSIHLEIVLILTQDRCTVCTEHTIGSKSFYTHPMKLLGDMSHVESHFGPFRDGVSVGARYGHCLHQTYHRLRNHFGRT
jgi:hypothetical protein